MTGPFSNKYVPNITAIYGYCFENSNKIPQYYYLHVILRNSTHLTVCAYPIIYLP
jgi:hypothetical protein